MQIIFLTCNAPTVEMVRHHCPTAGEIELAPQRVVAAV
jgi:hypothetical protein